MRTYHQYKHHGTMVNVRSDLKGKHREHCLCHDCQRFKPGTLNNCHIANAVFKNCVDFNIVTPMWECPAFLYGVPEEGEI